MDTRTTPAADGGGQPHADRERAGLNALAAAVFSTGPVPCLCGRHTTGGRPLGLCR